MILYYMRCFHFSRVVRMINVSCVSSRKLKTCLMKCHDSALDMPSKFHAQLPFDANFFKFSFLLGCIYRSGRWAKSERPFFMETLRLGLNDPFPYRALISLILWFISHSSSNQMTYFHLPIIKDKKKFPLLPWIIIIEPKRNH